MTLINKWKEAASLIILSRAFVKASDIQNGHNFQVLLLKRNDKTSFMPGSYVFPGGVVDTADLNRKWLSLFKHFGFDRDNLLLLSGNNNCPVFNEDINLTNGLHTLPKSVSLRISAIRETFEECGILLCKTSSEKSKWLSFLAGHEIQKWQSSVQNDPSKFIDLCYALKCVPDIWALHIWSNWLTPTHHSKRFDTAFFIATCDQIPPVFVDNKEIVEFKWHTPSELVSPTLCSKGDIHLPPPQFYELARLQQFQMIEDLHSNVSHNKFTCTQWMPVQIKTTNGLVSLLPGDYMYPDVTTNSCGDLQQLTENMESLRRNDATLHRMEIRNSRDMRIFAQNIPANPLSNILPCCTSYSEN